MESMAFDYKDSSLFYQFPIRYFRLDKAYLVDAIKCHQLLIKSDMMVAALKDSEKFKENESLIDLIIFSRIYRAISFLNYDEESKYSRITTEIMDDSISDSILYGVSKFKIWVPSIDWVISRYEGINYELRNYPDSKMMTQVKKEIVDEFFAGDFDDREFRVLAALNAILGNDRVKKIRKDRIGAAASGFVSTKEAEELGYNFYTDRQVGITLDKLERRGFFTRLNPDNRAYYFAKMDLEELAEWIEAKNAKREKLDRIEKRKKINNELKTQLNRKNTD